MTYPKMLSQNLFTLCMLTSFAKAAWYNDVFSSDGWQFGDDMTFRIEDTKDKNLTALDRLALRVDYGNIEVSAIQKPDKEAVQLDFLFKDEGRGKKSSMGNMLIPFFIGVTKGSLVTMVLSMMKILALKSLLLAKVALAISALVLASKYMKKHDPHYFEVEQHAASEPVPVFDHPGESTNNHIQAVAYSPYHAYAPSAAAESALTYATVVAAPVDNETMPVKAYYNTHSAVKRRDHGRRKVTPALLTIRHYSRPESGLI